MPTNDANGAARWVRLEAETRIDELLTEIARRALHVPTLATRHADQLDFHEVAAWQLRAALRLAYEAGRHAAGSTR